MTQTTLLACRTYGITFDRQCAAAGLPTPVSEHRFHPTRKWRFDWAIPSHRIAIEVEGGAWNSGRHTRGSGFEKDIEKYSEAICAGWTILRVTPKMIRTGQALGYLERVLQVGGRHGSQA